MLDRSRPLWELWFVEGLEGGNVAVIQKTHHTLDRRHLRRRRRDACCSTSPGSRPFPTHRSGCPTPAPSGAQLLCDTIAEEVGGPGARAASRHRRDAGAAAACSPRSVRSDAPSRPSPRAVSLRPSSASTSPSGATGASSGVNVPLDDVKFVHNTFGGTVNDVVLAGVAGGLAALLESRGELRPGLGLKVLCPVSVRSDDEHLALGNRVSAMVFPIPVGEPDPVARLAAVRATTAGLKERQQAVGAATLVGPHAVRGTHAARARGTRRAPATVLQRRQHERARPPGPALLHGRADAGGVSDGAVVAEPRHRHRDPLVLRRAASRHPHRPRHRPRPRCVGGWYRGRVRRVAQMRRRRSGHMTTLPSAFETHEAWQLADAVRAGELRRARPARGLPRAHRGPRPRTELRLLPRRGRRPGRGRCRRCDRRCRRRSGPAGRAAPRGEGTRARAGLAGHARVGGLRRRGLRLRRHRSCAPAGGRCGAHRPDHGVGARHGELHQHAVARHHPQPVGRQSHAGGLFGWIGSRGRGGLVPGVHGWRRWRLDPHPVGVLRIVRDESHLRPHRPRAGSVQLVAHARARSDGAHAARRRPLPRRRHRSDADRPHLASEARAVRARTGPGRRPGRAARQAGRIRVVARRSCRGARA